MVKGQLGPKSRSGAIAAGVMCAVLLIAIAWAAIIWTRPEPIRIAFASSLSGPSAPFGTESLVAAQLAIDEVNAKGGVNGRPIELVPFDDEASQLWPARMCKRSPIARASPCSDMISARPRSRRGRHTRMRGSLRSLEARLPTI